MAEQGQTHDHSHRIERPDKKPVEQTAGGAASPTRTTVDPSAAFGMVKYGPPSSITPQAVLALQRAAGNQAVQKLLPSRTHQGAAASPGVGFSLNDETAARIERARGGGQPLERSLQAEMSARMGHDFTGVRVHSDAEADALNQLVSAKAFTTGQDIFFRESEYSPGSDAGKRLVAHELTHVVQQSKANISASNRPIRAEIGSKGPGFEESVTGEYSSIQQSPSDTLSRGSIQRYRIDPGDRTKLKEKRYATGKTIQFTDMSSCIGIVGRKGELLTGIHLVLVANEPYNSMIPRISRLLEGSDEIFMFGNLDIWLASTGRFLQNLNNALGGAVDFIARGQGTWVVGPWWEGRDTEAMIREEHAEQKHVLPPPD